ncbi:MAG: Fic family protein [Pseudomonadota bacterium]
MSDFVWPDLKAILDEFRAAAEETGALFSGGTRNAVEAGYNRTRSTLSDTKTFDTADVAAHLFEAIAMRHPMADENKRIGLMCMVVFLDLNGANFDPPEIELYQQLVAFMTGGIDLPAFADYVRRNCVELPSR